MPTDAACPTVSTVSTHTTGPSGVTGELGSALSHLPLRTDAWVVGLHMEAAEQDGDLLLRLLEIGFLPGERVRVVARAFAGGDPLAVRVGRSTFALRRREAALVRICTTPPVAGAAG